MASPHRAILQSSSGTHLRLISTRAGYLMVEDGTAEEMEDAENGLPVFKLRACVRPYKGGAHPAQTSCVVATLTRGDMERNADAVIRDRHCRSRDKVDAWPDVHDTFAVTVAAGLVFIPDARLALKRVKQMRKEKASCKRSR